MHARNMSVICFLPDISLFGKVSRQMFKSAQTYKKYWWAPSPSVCKKMPMLILFGRAVAQTSQYKCLPRNSLAPLV